MFSNEHVNQYFAAACKVRSTWSHGEVIYLLSGRMTVQRDGDATVEITVGTRAIFPLGRGSTWTVQEALRNVFVIYMNHHA
ncbi:MAG: DUF861 domain-containing protein [Microbacteriaceae bacterium]|nr:MAG: DUF861 domain-containing protein [Microbacteriaceae bacterium]